MIYTVCIVGHAARHLRLGKSVEIVPEIIVLHHRKNLRWDLLVVPYLRRLIRVGAAL